MKTAVHLSADFDPILCYFDRSILLRNLFDLITACPRFCHFDVQVIVSAVSTFKAFLTEC